MIMLFFRFEATTKIEILKICKICEFNRIFL